MRVRKATVRLPVARASVTPPWARQSRTSRDASLGGGHAGGATLLSTLQAVSLIVWYRVAGSVSACSITTRMAESCPRLFGGVAISRYGVTCRAFPVLVVSRMTHSSRKEIGWNLRLRFPALNGIDGPALALLPRGPWRRRLLRGIDHAIARHSEMAAAARY